MGAGVVFIHKNQEKNARGNPLLGSKQYRKDCMLFLKAVPEGTAPSQRLTDCRAHWGREITCVAPRRGAWPPGHMPAPTHGPSRSLTLRAVPLAVRPAARGGERL